MKNPYPVAFLVTVAICAIIIVYHVAFRDDGKPSIAHRAVESSAPEAPSRDTAPAAPTVTFGAPRSSARSLLDATPPQRKTVAGGPMEPAAAAEPTDQRLLLSPPAPDAATASRENPLAAPPATQPTEPAAVTPVPTVTLTTEARPAPTAPAPPPAPRPRTYTIKPGDNLSSIALSLYGSDEYWDEIAQANPLVDPTKLKVGQVIYLPTMETIRGQREAATTTAAPPQTATYVVRSGDTLWNIAVQYYENGRLWRHLYNANRSQIGDDPDKLEAGTKLRIPPPPDTAR